MILESELYSSDIPYPVDEKGKLIARGIIALPSSIGGGDPSEFPFGYPSAISLDEAFANEKASLILTAISKQGPPVAAKRFNLLKDLKFPFIFELTTDDLLFPYNTEIWEKSPLSGSKQQQECESAAFCTPEVWAGTSCKQKKQRYYCFCCIAWLSFNASLGWAGGMAASAFRSEISLEIRVLLYTGTSGENKLFDIGIHMHCKKEKENTSTGYP